jgi:hypothetical protein
MDLAYFLNMTDITVYKDTVSSDGMGGVTTTTTSTLIPKGTIYQEGSLSRYTGFSTFLAGKFSQEISHLLICEPDDYAWSLADKRVTHDSLTYDIVGTPYAIMEVGEVMMVGLRLRV